MDRRGINGCFIIAFLQFDGNTTSSTVDELVPYGTYVFKVEACTVAGCTMSEDSRRIQTLRARKFLLLCYQSLNQVVV